MSIKTISKTSNSAPKKSTSTSSLRTTRKHRQIRTTPKRKITSHTNNKKINNYQQPFNNNNVIHTTFQSTFSTATITSQNASQQTPEHFEFRTIESSIEETLLKEKGSKFLGYAMPINNEIELQDALGYIRGLHPRATHHCYGYRLGVPDTRGYSERANDDGEPSGSAGLPILNQLYAFDITNVLFVCVRYYGGTKLGVSGLIQAYKGSAALTLKDATIVTKELEAEYLIKFKDFSHQNHIYSLLNKNGARAIDCIYAESDDDFSFVHAALKLSNQDSILKQIADISIDIQIEPKLDV